MDCSAIDSPTQIVVTCNKQVTEPVPPPVVTPPPTPTCTPGSGGVQNARWLTNGLPSGTYSLPDPYGTTAIFGYSYAQRFTLTPDFPNIRVNLGYSSQTGGTAAKEVTISKCPNDFSDAISTKCRVSFGSSQATSLYILQGSSTYHCAIPPGTYYLNIRALTPTPASAVVSATVLSN